MSMPNKEQLILDNQNLVYHIVRKEYPTFIYDEDIVQCGMVGLCKAADAFDESKAKFSTYAGRCIRNEIYKEFLKRKEYSQHWSLDYSKTGDDKTFGEILCGEKGVDFESYDFLDCLTEEEKQVLRLHRYGYTKGEIADVLGIEPRQAGRLLRTIKLKFTRYEEEK